MTTTPVANTASSAPSSSTGNSNASRKADSAGNPFQQMLSEEIAGKTPNSNKAEEPAPDTTATSKQTPAASEKEATPETSSASGKEERNEATASELAATVASLLQQQRAASGETHTETGSEEESDPLSTLTKGLSRQARDAQGRQAALANMAELADDKLADAARHATQAFSKAGTQSASDQDLHAAMNTRASIEAVSSEGQATDFSNTLQQLTHSAQAAQTRNGQPAAPTHLAPRVGTSAWDQALGQRVVWMASGLEQSASLTLNPPELGPLQVVLNVTNNQANATFVAPQAEVRQALEAALPRLREMLEEAGIQLDQASVNQDMPQQQGDFARSEGRSGLRGHISDKGGPEQNVTEPVLPRRAVAAGNGLVDTFA